MFYNILIILCLLFIIVSKGIEDDFNRLNNNNNNNNNKENRLNNNNNINRRLINNDNDNQGNLPKLFVLGPQKSGSSSLFEYLTKHPQLCGGIHKEEYYISDDVLFSKGHREGYKKMFRDTKCDNKPQTMYIDATPQFNLMYKVIPRFPQIFTPQEMQVI